MGNTPVKPQDYYDGSVIARYGYFSRVLRPGMMPDAIKAAIKALQTTTGGPLGQPFVTSLSDTEIDSFIRDWEIVGSSADNQQAQRTGLDAVVLRSRTTQRLAVSIGGVGPYDLDAVEGAKLVAQSEVYGFDMSEFLALKAIFDPIQQTYSSDSIDIFGHSKGGQLSSILYADLVLSGNGNRVNGAFQFSPVGVDIRSHSSDLYKAGVFGLYGDAVDPALFDLAGKYIDILKRGDASRSRTSTRRLCRCMRAG